MKKLIKRFIGILFMMIYLSSLVISVATVVAYPLLVIFTDKVAKPSDWIAYGFAVCCAITICSYCHWMCHIRETHWVFRWTNN